MRILLLEPAGHQPGHHTHYTRCLADHLLGTGEVEQVTVVSSCGFLEPFPERTGLTVVQAWPERELGVPAPVENRPYWARCTRAAFAAALPLMAQHDVVHALDCHPDTLARQLLCRRRLRHRFVYLNQVGPTAAMIPPRRWPPYGVRTRLLFAAERWLFRHLAVQTHSETVARRIRDYGRGARVTVIPPGVEPAAGRLIGSAEARRQLGLPDDGRRALLVFGFQGPHKGVDRLLDAARLGGHDFRLLVAGAPAATCNAEQLIDDAGWRERSRVKLAFIPDDEVGTWFAAADGVLLAYPRFFVFDSGVMNRAAAYRTPVLVSAVGHLAEVMDRWPMGESFAPEDTASLSAALGRWLAADETTRAGWHAALADYAAEHAWPRIAGRQVALYQAVAHGVVGRV